jgi:uncharacterized membrane protein
VVKEAQINLGDDIGLSQDDPGILMNSFERKFLCSHLASQNACIGPMLTMTNRRGDMKATTQFQRDLQEIKKRADDAGRELNKVLDESLIDWEAEAATSRILKDTLWDLDVLITGETETADLVYGARQFQR